MLGAGVTQQISVLSVSMETLNRVIITHRNKLNMVI